MNIFERRNLREYTDSLAAYMPSGELFRKRYIQGSNFRKLLTGLANEMYRSNGYLMEYVDQILPDQTEKFIDEWESVVGIPDGCLNGTGTNEERRSAVLVKLFALGIQTTDDFVTLAALFGITVDVYAGKDVLDTPSLAPNVVFDGEHDARFTIVVTYDLSPSATFTYTFPILFGNNEVVVLECLFNRVKPANCTVIFSKV